MRTALVNEKGHIVVLTMKPSRGYGLTVEDYRTLESMGAITIHEVGGNDLADMYGRVRLTYTIN
jgi:hypothetical protein